MIVARFISQILLFCVTFLLCTFSQELVDNEFLMAAEKNCSSLRFPFYCGGDGAGCIPKEQFCDGVAQCRDGSDEKLYEQEHVGNTDGINCTRTRTTPEGNVTVAECLLPKRYVGDKIKNCVLGEDECNYNHSFECATFPYGGYTNQCILRSFFCNGIFDCFDRSDELRFVPAYGSFQCKTSKYQQTSTCDLPAKYVCDGIADCEKGVDECFCDPTTGAMLRNSYTNEQCFRCLDGDLILHHKQLCDGKFQCKDLSDECMCANKPPVCNNICKDGMDCDGCGAGQVLCSLNASSTLHKCINISQICDSIYDCPLQDDEVNCNVDMSETFTCKDQSKYLPKNRHCNNITDCLDGSDEEDCSTLFFNCNPTSYRYRNPNEENAYEPFRPRFTKACDNISFCEDFEDECNATLCGQYLPPYCEFVEGEDGFVCPDSGYTLMGSEICDGYPQCNVDHPDWSSDELYCPNRFYCEDRGKQKVPIHIPLSAKCDNISDCYDESDEVNCSLNTHFYCEFGSVKFVPRSKVCDGIQDCKGGEDECQNCSVSPFSSDKFLINPYLQVFIWLIGVVSVIGNLVVLCHNFTLFGCGKTNSRLSFNHRILVTNLATADLLLGIYLISLGIVNQQYEGIYCKRDIQWRSSKSCVAMGTMAVISTECSIFLMVTMATMRLTLVACPFSSTIRRRYVIIGIVTSWTMALMIALTPLAESQIDYFVSQVWYKHNPFLRLADRNNLTQVATYIWSLNDGANHSFENLTQDRSLTWDNMINTVILLNETFRPTLRFGYYSAHGVCLPRLFPDVEKDRSWGFSLFVIIINFISFIYMLVAYITIYKITSMQSREAGRSDVDLATAKLQRKVTRIIFTDFCCWIPICIMAFMSAAGYHLSSETYAVSAIILLPINSAFNPLLYSDLPDLIWRKIGSKTRFGQWLRQREMEWEFSRRSTVNTYLS